MLSSTDFITLDFLTEQLGESYSQRDETERSGHVALLQSVQHPKDVVTDVQRVGQSRWKVTVCSADSIGMLSAIAGLFTSYHLNIVSVEVFTIQVPRQEPSKRRSPSHRRGVRSLKKSRTAPPRRMILDIFELRALDDVDDETWMEIRESLVELVRLLVEGKQDAAREVIIERVSRAVQVAGNVDEPLFSVSIDVEDVPPNYTLLSIRSADTLGFLFAFTNALTMFKMNIVRAEIRTVDGEVHDLFWLTETGGGSINREERVQELRVAAALIKHFTYLLPRSPNPGQALRQFHALTQQMLSRPDWTAELRDLESAPVLEVLADLMGVSQFLWEDFLRMQHNNLFPVLLDIPSLERPPNSDVLREECIDHLRGLAYDDTVRELNQFKDREMFRIDIRHITGRVDFRGFAEELSDLATVVVEQAAEISYRSMVEKHGHPTLEDGSLCPWSVCALGKFGGRELGYGSDIELIFVYRGEGLTDGPTPMENSRFMGEMVKTFLTVLESRREGIFEIDLRLRPYGNGGPLASALDAFKRYYSRNGDARQFERMALVRLRPVAGDKQLGDDAREARDAYVYSDEPLDRENILHLRGRQANESVTPGSVNAKYSSGGLVDMEYFVQACQIALGHNDPGVRVTNTKDAIDRMSEGGHISEEFARHLNDTYAFLRRLIDALRVVRGHARDLTIPSAESRSFAYLSQRLQFDSAAELESQIKEQMAFAQDVWNSDIL